MTCDLNSLSSYQAAVASWCFRRKPTSESGGNRSRANTSCPDAIAVLKRGAAARLAKGGGFAFFTETRLAVLALLFLNHRFGQARIRVDRFSPARGDIALALVEKGRAAQSLLE